MIATQHPADPDLPLPPLDPRAAELLAAFITPGFSIQALLQERGLSITELLNWHRRPDVQAHLDAFFALLEDAARAAALQVRPTAINTLGELALTATDPLERRRAALPALRASGPIRHRAHASDVPRLRTRSGSPAAPAPSAHAEDAPTSRRHLAAPSPGSAHDHETPSSAPGRGSGGDVRRGPTEGASSSPPLDPPDAPAATRPRHPSPAHHIRSRPAPSAHQRRPLSPHVSVHLPANPSPRPYDVADDSSVHEPAAPAPPSPTARPPPALSL